MRLRRDTSLLNHGWDTGLNPGVTNLEKTNPEKSLGNFMQLRLTCRRCYQTAMGWLDQGATA